MMTNIYDIFKDSEIRPIDNDLFVWTTKYSWSRILNVKDGRIFLQCLGYMDKFDVDEYGSETLDRRCIVWPSEDVMSWDEWQRYILKEGMFVRMIDGTPARICYKHDHNDTCEVMNPKTKSLEKVSTFSLTLSKTAGADFLKELLTEKK